MIIPLKGFLKKGRGILIILIVVLLTIEISPFFKQNPQQVEANLENLVFESVEIPEFIIFQKNSLAPLSSPVNPEPKVIEKINVVITGYSSTLWETDDDPYLTAAGTLVREGIVANNKYPFGTKIRIPEIFGDKIFVIEDRMHWKKGYYHIDIWFPDYWQALNFGAKRTYIEILES